MVGVLSFAGARRRFPKRRAPEARRSAGGKPPGGHTPEQAGVCAPTVVGFVLGVEGRRFEDRPVVGCRIGNQRHWRRCRMRRANHPQNDLNCSSRSRASWHSLVRRVSLPEIAYDGEAALPGCGAGRQRNAILQREAIWACACHGPDTQECVVRRLAGGGREGSTLVRHTEEGLGALNDPRRSPCSRNSRGWKPRNRWARRTFQGGGKGGTGRWSWGLYSVRVGDGVGDDTAPVVTKLSWCRGGRVRSRRMCECVCVSGGGRRGAFRQRAPDTTTTTLPHRGEGTAASRARLGVLEIFRRARPQPQHTAARCVAKRRLFVAHANCGGERAALSAG